MKYMAYTESGESFEITGPFQKWLRSENSDDDESVLYIEREDVVRVSPREFAERVLAFAGNPTSGPIYGGGESFWKFALNEVVEELEGEINV